MYCWNRKDELGHERDWQQCKVKIKKKNLRAHTEISKIIMERLGGGKRYANSIKDEILGHRPVSTAPVLDSGATTNTSTSLDSAEEEETNGNHSSMTKQRYLT